MASAATRVDAAVPPAEQAPPAATGYSHAQIMRVISGIMLCILLAALDQTVVIPAVPAIASDLNGFGHLSWIVTAYLLTSTAVTPIYGKLSDIYGRRALLIPALVVFLVTSAMCAMAQSLVQLIIFRALQGIGGGGLMAMAQAAVADVVSPRERGRYQGYMAGMWGIASIAGPIVGGYVTDHLSWRWVFWLNVPLILAAIVLCDRGLRVLPVRRGKARIDVIGAVLLMAGVTAWLMMLSWGGVEFPWSSAPILGLLIGGVLCMVVLAWHERRDADPLLPPRLFTNPVFLRGVILAFMTSFGLFAATFMLPLFFQLVRHADAGESGLLVIPFLGSSVVGAFTGGQLARRLGRTKIIILGGLGATAFGFALLALMGPSVPLVLPVVAMLILGTGIGATLPSVLVMVQNAAERRDVGVATGSLLFLRSMGGAFGSTLGGALLAIGFHGGLARAGITRTIDLGSLREGSDALAGMTDSARLTVLSGLNSGFTVTFWVVAGVFLIAMAVAAGARDLPLRSVSAAEPAVGH